MKKLFNLAICAVVLLFVSCEPNKPDNPGYKAKAFSVSETKQVIFSRGNLQYHPANNKWRFAESQLD